ncbi:MAG: CsgG/HfaB family protein [Parvibaculales bacterium]
MVLRSFLFGVLALVISSQLTAPVWAKTTIVSITTTAEGATEDIAVTKAIESAVKQINGVSIKIKNLTEVKNIEGTSTTKSGQKENFSLSLSRQTKDEISAQGLVESYRILSIKPSRDGLVQARVKSNIYKYQASKSTNRKRIVLVPSQANKSSYDFYGYQSAANLSAALDDEIERYLVNSRKFSVLTRRDFGAMNDEFAVIASEASKATDKAKLGQLLGGDYLLVVKVKNADAIKRSKTIQVSGRVKTWIDGEMSISVRLIDAATGEIKFSGSFSTPANQHETSQSALGAVSRSAIDDLVQRIYPNRIISIDDGLITLNAGGDSVTQNAIYDVFKPGKKIIDPYTKEVLGTTEQQVGVVKIIMVKPKFSVAEPVKDGPFEVGMILRASAKPEQKQKPTPAPAPRATTGYKLPFER